MRRDSGTRSPRSFSLVAPSQRSISLPEFASMALHAAEAEQRQSADWLKEALGARLQNELTQAMDWQAWCWGRDVAEIPGNGLLRMKFERCSPPTGIKCSSCYRQTQWRSDGTPQRLALRGNGVFYGEQEPQGIFVSRYRFAPCLHCSEPYPPLNWTHDRSLIIQAPRTEAEQRLLLRLIVGLFHRIADYERAVLPMADPAHRLKCREKWHKPVPMDLDDLARSWQAFAAEIGSRRSRDFECRSVA